MAGLDASHRGAGAMSDITPVPTALIPSGSASAVLLQRSGNSSRRTLLSWVLSVQSYYIFFVGLVPGFMLLFGSILAGFGSFTAPAPEFAPVNREVGYLAAVNWSLAYAVFFPGALYLMAEALQGIADALDHLHLRGMVRNKDMQVVHETIITESWIKGTSARSLLLVIFAGIIPIAYSLGEWLPFNLLRLLHRGPSAEYSDYDWGLAGIIHTPGEPEWPLIGRLLNGAFDLLAFSTEGLLIASSFAFFLLLLDLGRVLPSYERKGALFLVPDLKGEDRRRGFEVFADPLQKTLGVALLTYLILYCVRLEGVYMMSPDAKSLADFVQSDLLSGVTQATDPAKGNALTGILQHLFSTAGLTTRGQLAWLMAVLVFTCSLILVVMLVRQAAARAIRNASRHNSKSLFGEDIATELNQAKSMVVWPLGYLKLSKILIVMFLATCTLYFYRIGLFVAGFVVAGLLMKLVYGLFKPPSSGGSVPGHSSNEN